MGGGRDSVFLVMVSLFFIASLSYDFFSLSPFFSEGNEGFSLDISACSSYWWQYDEVLAKMTLVFLALLKRLMKNMLGLLYSLPLVVLKNK